MFNGIAAMFQMKELFTFTFDHHFQLFHLKTERYTLVFCENSFGRSVRFEGEHWFGKREIWKGTEYYSLVVKPWLRYDASSDDLRETMAALMEAQGKALKDNNVIRKSKSYWRQSSENQSEE